VPLLARFLGSAPVAFAQEGQNASREGRDAPSARDHSSEVGGNFRHEIARRVGVASSTVRLTLQRLGAAGLSWPLPAEMTNAALEERLFATVGSKQGHRRQPEPD